MKVLEDPGDLLWTHLELLRKCKLVAVTQKPSAAQSAAGNNSSLPAPRGAPAPGKHKQVMSLMPQGGLGQPGVTGQPARKTAPKNPVTLGKAKLTVLTESKSPNGGNRSGNNGQVTHVLQLHTEICRASLCHFYFGTGLDTKSASFFRHFEKNSRTKKL